MSITMIKIMDRFLQEIEEEHAKQEEFQKNLEKYIRKHFHDCLDQFGMKENNKRMKTHLDEAEQAIQEPYDIDQDNFNDPIKVNEEEFDEIVDIFKLSTEEFNKLFDNK